MGLRNGAPSADGIAYMRICLQLRKSRTMTGTERSTPRDLRLATCGLRRATRDVRRAEAKKDPLTPEEGGNGTAYNLQDFKSFLENGGQWAGMLGNLSWVR